MGDDGMPEKIEKWPKNDSGDKSGKSHNKR